MDFLTILIGFFSVSFSIYILFLRLKGNEEKLKKMKFMVDKWGTKGSILHLIGYIFLPFIFGIIFIILGVKGVSIFN